MKKITNESKDNFSKLTDSNIRNILKLQWNVEFYVKRKHVMMTISSLKKTCFNSFMKKEKEEKWNF